MKLLIDDLFGENFTETFYQNDLVKINDIHKLKEFAKSIPKEFCIYYLDSFLFKKIDKALNNKDPEVFNDFVQMYFLTTLFGYATAQLKTSDELTECVQFIFDQKNKPKA